MSKATEFSPKEVVLVAVNSIITKLFLLFPSTLTTVGKSSSIILCLLTAAAGVIILYAIAALYGKAGNKSIITITGKVFGKAAKRIYAYIIAAVFIIMCGLLLRSVSESINMSLMPAVDVNIISLIFIIGVSVAAYVGLKAIVRCHAVVVPITLAAAAVLFAGSIKSFDANDIYPVFGDGVKNLLYSLLFTTYFTDFFVITMIFPYMQKSAAAKPVIMRSAVYSSAVLIAIISAVVLAVENNTVIPVFRLAREFSFSSSSAVESIFTSLWFLSFYLNFSLMLYYGCKLFAMNGSYSKIIVPFAFITYGISVLPSNITVLARWTEILDLVKLAVFFVIPIIILSASALKKEVGDK